MDGSTGDRSDDWGGGGLGEEEEEKGEDDDKESDWEEGGNIGDDDNEGGKSLRVDPTNLFSEAVRIDFEQGGRDGGANVDGDAGVDISATVSVSVASSCIVSTTGRGKRAGAQESVGGEGRGTKAFMQPLRIPRKSPSNSIDDGGGGDGFTFGKCK